MVKFFYIFFLLLLSNCGTQEKKTTNSLPTEEQAILVYKEGLDALEKRDFLCIEKFGEAEILLPLSNWASKSALMTGYCFYSINFYDEAVSTLKRFVKTYPASKDLDYANYLIAISFYEQILDEEKDIQPL